MCVLFVCSALLEALDVFGEFNPTEFGIGSEEEEDEKMMIRSAIVLGNTSELTISIAVYFFALSSIIGSDCILQYSYSVAHL